MKRTVNFCFKFALCVLFLLFNSALYAQTLYFQCQSESIPEEAKGVYQSINKKMVYITPDNKTINLFERKNIDGGKIRYSEVCWWIKTENDLEFTAFDKNGNFYFLASCSIERSGKIQRKVTCIYKYDPVANLVSVYSMSEDSQGCYLCVSDDGRWVFINIIENINTKNYKGFSKVYALETSFDKEPELIFKAFHESQHTNGIYNLCFDSNTKNLLFMNNGWTEKDDSCIGSGLYVLHPDENGNYSNKNLEIKYYMSEYQLSRLYANMNKDNQIDYNYFLKALKFWSTPKINYNTLELNLSYFNSDECIKNFGNKFLALYDEDEKGNVLREYEAAKHLYEKRNLFNQFITNYNILNDRIFSSIPLDVLIYNRSDKKPVWSYDYDFLKNPIGHETGYLYSNKDGVWGLIKVNDGSQYSKIYKITDKKGNYIGSQVDGLNNYLCRSIWQSPKPMITTQHGLTFVDIRDLKIYHYENGTITEKTDLVNKPYTNDFNDLKLVAEMLEKESVEEDRKKYIPQPQIVKVETVVESDNYIPFEMDTSEGLKLQTQVNNFIEMAKSRNLMEQELHAIQKKNKIYLIITIVSVCLALIMFCILIFRFTAKMREINRIKTNKKFIFDIQEKERGKISRDIHDSVIQDIRAIRIDTELMKVDEESQERKNKVIALATDCVVKLRNICYNLTPAELTTHAQGDSTKIELISIIQSLVIQFIERTHVPCQLKIDENFEYPVYPKEISQNLFRIIQEALNNIEKHSYATNCQILIKNKVEDDKKYMLIYVSDDGIGCDVEQLLKKSKNGHFGLQNMRDRAELIGASLEFFSEQGQGMEIRIKI